MASFASPSAHEDARFQVLALHMPLHMALALHMPLHMAPLCLTDTLDAALAYTKPY